MKKTQMAVARLREIKNSLTGDAKDFADAVLAAFQELQDDEQEHGVDELQKQVEEISKKFATPEDVENSIGRVKDEILRTVRDSVMGGGKQGPVSQQVANAVCAALVNSANRAECVAKLNKIAAENGITLKKKQNDLTGLTYQELVDYSLNIKQDDADEVFDALKQTPFGTFFYAQLDAKNAKQIAKQWDKTAEASVTKDIQEVAVNGKTLTTKSIYKMLRVANEDLDSAAEVGQENALIASGRAELRKSVKSSVVRAMLIGDTVNPDGKKITTFETVGTKKATDLYTTVLNPEGADVTLADMLRLVKSVKTERKWLFISSAMEVKLRTMIYAAGGTTMIIGLDELAKMLGVERIINKDYLDEVTGLYAVVIDPSEYWVKNKKTLDVTFPEYKENSLYLLYEMNMGGSIHGIQSTAVLRAAD